MRVRHVLAFGGRPAWVDAARLEAARSSSSADLRDHHPELGLRPIGEIKSRTMSARVEVRKVFSPVSLEIQGRTGRFDVVEVPDALPNIVGQIPLEDLDWVVDCRNQKLIPNPEHKHGELSDEF